MAYRIIYSPHAEEHLRVLTARQRRTIFDTVDEQPAHQPPVETRSRKSVRPNPVASKSGPATIDVNALDATGQPIPIEKIKFIA